MTALRHAVCHAWQCLLCGHWTSLPVCPCTSYTARES